MQAERVEGPGAHAFISVPWANTGFVNSHQKEWDFVKLLGVGVGGDGCTKGKPWEGETLFITGVTGEELTFTCDCTRCHLRHVLA